MIPIIVGSNLTDLGRNSLAAAQQDQDASQATSNRLLQYLMEQNHNRQVNSDIALRQRQADQQNALANAALSQQGHIADMQWNNPNATTMAVNSNNLTTAKLPWTMGITPEQAAQNALLQKQIETSQMPYTLAAQGVPIGNGPVAQAAAQLSIDKSQRAEKMDGALKAANATYLGTVNMPHPIDWIMPGDRNTKIANTVRSQLGGSMPEVNELIFDRSANNGVGGFISPDQPQAPVVNPFTAAAALASSRTNSVPPAPVTNQLLSIPNPNPTTLKPIDLNSARIFLQQAGGDPQKARVLATQAGYAF